MNYFSVPINLITRFYDEESFLPEYRTEFMRDRDRVMYATAFRRLAGKTQIYTVGTDDHKRNRLTHTLEVSQIARTIALALDLNPDLAEAIALGHDFGHTPFGHAGELMLHEIMTPDSHFIKNSPFYMQNESAIIKRFKREKVKYPNNLYGFKHNLQSVRVAASLEDSYRNKDGKNIGLNLTNFSLYGMMIHSNLLYKSSHLFNPNFQNSFINQMCIKNSDRLAWSLEAYVVCWADEIAQWHHDLEDAIRGFALPAQKIKDTIVEAFKELLSDSDTEKLCEICENNIMDRKSIAELSHIVVNTLVSDLIDTSKLNMEKISREAADKGIENSEMIFNDYDILQFTISKDKIINISEKINKVEFETVIRESVHHSRNVERMNEKGKYIIRKLFEAYFTHPQQLPDGPILHLLVEINPEKYKNIDIAKTFGIGVARTELNELIENADINIEVLLMRRICDHIASMTDHYAIEEYNNLYG